MNEKIVTFKIRKNVVSALIGYQPNSIKSWMILLDNHVDIHDKCDFSILKTPFGASYEGLLCLLVGRAVLKKKKKWAAPTSRDPYEMRSISVIRGVTISFELLLFLFLYVFSPYFKGVTVSTNTFLSPKIVKWKPCVRFETSLSDWAKQFNISKKINDYF